MNSKLAFTKVLKVVFYLGNLVGIIWWAVHSINNYNQWPTSSNVVLQYGDDGKGNVKFPALTICPEIPALNDVNSTKVWNGQSNCKKVNWTLLTHKN